MEGETKPNSTDTRLERIAVRSGENPQEVFVCLMPHFNRESLIKCFHELGGKKAVGIDRQTKEDYGKNLQENIDNLVRRLRTMKYMPGPVREVKIPKEDGTPRPLGISNFEDKIIQLMMSKVLEAIYEPLFHDLSYGFRRGRSCHDAIKALQNHLFKRPVECVFDADLKNFFGTISHEKLMRILKMKVKDRRFREYVVRMLKAGVLSDGELKVSAEGTPQGSIVSPILANIFAHYAYDKWFVQKVKPNASSSIGMFRYADDLVLCGSRRDVQVAVESFKARTERFSLKLNEDKSKVVPFDRRRADKERQGVFDFLGFTFYIAKGRRGYQIPKLKTSSKRLRKKLKMVNEWCKRSRNLGKLGETWRKFRIKLGGHIRYYGVSHNMRGISLFSLEATRVFFKWMNRRSQKKCMSWEDFKKFMKVRPLPALRIWHNLFEVSHSERRCRPPCA